eukprot:COSAG02_NODE_5800_length_4028_cov_3.961313_2_plen_49_part_00
MESELLAAGNEVPPSLAARIKKLRKRFDLATIATRDGDLAVKGEGGRR